MLICSNQMSDGLPLMQEQMGGEKKSARDPAKTFPTLLKDRTIEVEKNATWQDHGAFRGHAYSLE